VGDILSSRTTEYIVEKKLGWGHFSTVWLCSDTRLPNDHPRKLVAIKVQKSAPQYAEAAKDEIELLEDLARNDPLHIQPVVKYYEDFTVVSSETGETHMAIVFAVAGANLLSLIKKYNYKGQLCVI